MNPSRQTEREKLEHCKKSPWSFFIRNRIISFIVVVGIITSGVISAYTIPKEAQPEVKIPMAVVATTLPGATPTDVEALLTKPVENKIAGLSDINKLSSSSGFNSSIVTVEFDADVEISDAINDLQKAADQAKSDLPDDVIGPEVIEISFSDFPIITFSLISDISPLDLSEIAETVKLELEGMSGVLKAPISGQVEKEIKIILDQAKLENLGMTILDISNIIKFSNFNLPAGAVNIDTSTYSIRFEGRITQVEELSKIVIAPDVLLGDIATVLLKTDKQSSLSRIAEAGGETRNAISISVYKTTGGNIIEVADKSKELVDQLKEDKLIPDGVDVIVASDNSFFIREDLNTLTTSGVQTFFIIIAILFLAIGLRQGLLASIAVPLTFLIALTLLQAQGQTLNSLTMFSLVISLGLLVDTAIVIMEGIHTNITEGYTVKEAAMISIETFRWPLITGTATTVFVFFPMLLLSGIIGQFMKTMPITISAALISSLFISLAIIPAIATKFIKADKFRAKTPKNTLSPLINWLKKKQEKRLNISIKSKWKRRGLILAPVVAFIASLMLPASGILGVEMFGNFGVDYFVIKIETPRGTVLEETEKVVTKVENLVYEIPELKNFVSVVGSNQSAALTDEGLSGAGTNLNSHVANITVNLTEKGTRKRASYDIAGDFRDKVKATITEGKITVVEIQGGPPSEAPVVVNVTGNDMDTLKEIAAEVKTKLETIEGTKNVSDNLSKGLNEFVYTLDRDKLAYHGLSGIQVAATIRGIVQETNATEITLNGEDIEVNLQYNTDDLSISNIENFQIPSPKGYSVPLKDIGSYSFEESLSSIQHKDEEKIATVTSEITTDANALLITEEIQNKMADYQVPNGFQITYGGDLENITGSFNELGQAMLIGILLIAMTLILQFNSIKQTLIILFTLPLGLIGVFPGLMLLGMDFSFSAFIGIVALAGVVVNNAIVLIDRMNKNRIEEEMSLEDAVLDGARSRLQPIILTTITTVLGMIPIAFADEFWRGISVSLAFGLSTSTMLTLVVTPSMYYAFERKKALKAGKTPRTPHTTPQEDLPMPEPEKTIFNVVEGDPVKKVQDSVNKNNGELPDIHSIQ
ncbi:efflux RND transporter permease subunit [Candidatus Peregrinibacteria bacterium]|jgi:multidrug efflux pump|nr:efflux RND transporter permease subunit [Candidatus Peregrinibacteria bacterium]MBT4055642.1 efflux RND transporter permease subunit [Candidatus Peregrinibacteria bacterium]